MQFPIAELGNCGSMQECKIYCDAPEHQNACMQWTGKKTEPKAGPGGCTSREECDNFCKKKENVNTCLDFAVKDGFMTKAEADKMRKFEARRKHKPKKRPEPEEPKIDEEKVKKLLEEIGGPGGCVNFEECDNFCSQRENEETCMSFAIEHGLFDEHEAERIKKMMSIEGPGGCKGIECKHYCEKSGRELECMEFAHKQGFMDEEEYQEVKKFMEATGGTGIGPGSCYAEECEEYCDDPAHQDECFEFFKKHDMIDPEELEMIENMKKREIEMERKIWQEREKEKYWQGVEEQQRKDEERAKQEQMEFEKIEPAPFGALLYPFLQLLR